MNNEQSDSYEARDASYLASLGKYTDAQIKGALTTVLEEIHAIHTDSIDGIKGYDHGVFALFPHTRQLLALTVEAGNRVAAKNW